MGGLGCLGLLGWWWFWGRFTSRRGLESVVWSVYSKEVYGVLAWAGAV